MGIRRDNQLKRITHFRAISSQEKFGSLRDVADAVFTRKVFCINYDPRYVILCYIFYSLLSYHNYKNLKVVKLYLVCRYKYLDVHGVRSKRIHINKYAILN